ncbi:MAG: cytochrome C [Betaproteobacteria bacterium]
MIILRWLISAALLFVVLDITTAADAAEQTAAVKGAAARSIERGRYVVKISGCNDCHTAGYAMSGGSVPEKTWLTGDHLGWRGPWGTTYARNLRRFMSAITEDEWVKLAHTAQFRPPMPWFALRDMSEADLRSVYRFVRQLGPVGEQVPDYVPPDREPAGPASRPKANEE